MNRWYHIPSPTNTAGVNPVAVTAETASFLDHIAGFNWIQKLIFK
jgi:hypothetical protein